MHMKTVSMATDIYDIFCHRYPPEYSQMCVPLYVPACPSLCVYPCVCAPGCAPLIVCSHGAQPESMPSSLNDPICLRHTQTHTHSCWFLKHWHSASAQPQHPPDKKERGEAKPEAKSPHLLLLLFPSLSLSCPFLHLFIICLFLHLFIVCLFLPLWETPSYHTNQWI